MSAAVGGCGWLPRARGQSWCPGSLLKPWPEQPLDEGPPVPLHAWQLSSQLPGPGPTTPVITSRGNSSQYSISCLFITCYLPTPSAVLLEAEDEMSQRTMSKGPLSCHEKMRGPWEGYLGLGAAAWLIIYSSLANRSVLKGMLGIIFFFMSYP